MIPDVLAVSIIGALIAIDRTAAFQVMISRPIVAAPVIGVLLGNPAAGLLTGVALELLFIGELPVGRYVPVNDTLLSITATAAACYMLGQEGKTVHAAMKAVPICIIAVLPLSFLYHRADTLVRKWNERFYDRALARIESGAEIALFRENIKGAGLFFVSNAAAIFVTAWPLMYMAGYAGGILNSVWALYASYAAAAVLGIASALNAVYTERSLYVYAASFVSMAALWFVL